jgi:hypothetical protein
MKIWTGTWNMGAADPFLDADTETANKLLAPFVPLDYDVYVLGIQEGISDSIFAAVEAYTGAFRLPLNARLYSARDASGAQLRSRRVGRAIKIEDFIHDADEGLKPDPVVSTTDMLDRVWGRGDGALLQPKFTGIAVFVAPVAAPYCRLLGVYKHSFGASEGSKGGVGVALGLYNVTIAFINTHMASKRADMRRAQYQELVDRLGSKLGGRGFGLNESFHHIVWMGDLNVHCKGLSATDATSLIKQGKHLQMLMHHDELLIEKDEETSFFEYEEPMMGPRFFPTYKKMPGRGPLDVKDPTWVSRAYVTAYKEPMYKGGRVMERVPSWTDRIQYHSLPDKWGELMPECLDKSREMLDQARGEPPIHNYHSVNDTLDTSDHSPVFCTFTLQIVVDEVDHDAEVDEKVSALQAGTGYAQAQSGGDLNDSIDAGGPTRSSTILFPAGTPSALGDATFTELHPLLRPLQVDLTIYGLTVEYHGNMNAVPRALTIVFPLPFEDSNEIPDRAKVMRDGSGPVSGFLGSIFGRGQDSMAIRNRTIISRAHKLESMHVLVKVSMDDNIKAQAVFSMKDGGFIGAGTHMTSFRLPLTSHGLPLKSNGQTAMVKFTMEMNAFERGGVMQTTTSTVSRAAHVSAVHHSESSSAPATSTSTQSQQPSSSTTSAAPPPLPIAPRPLPTSTSAVPSSNVSANTPARPPQGAPPGQNGISSALQSSTASNTNTPYTASSAAGAPKPLGLSLPTPSATYAAPLGSTPQPNSNQPGGMGSNPSNNFLSPGAPNPNNAADAAARARMMAAATRAKAFVALQPPTTTQGQS